MIGERADHETKTSAVLSLLMRDDELYAVLFDATWICLDGWF